MPLTRHAILRRHFQALVRCYAIFLLSIPRSSMDNCPGIRSPYGIAYPATSGRGLLWSVPRRNRHYTIVGLTHSDNGSVSGNAIDFHQLTGSSRPLEGLQMSFTHVRSALAYPRLIGILAYPPKVPSDAAWITGIGVAFFLFNLCLFIMNCVLISIRFHLRPGSLRDSFTDQVESLFIPAFVRTPL